MIEVEIKVCIKNKKRLEQGMEQFGFMKGSLLRETDWYFDNMEGTFRKSDKALRIRQCENLTSKENISYITYKGPKLDNISMTRKELEIRIDDAKTGKEILQNLGFLPVFPVVKLRQYFHKDDMTACLDQVENLGDYLELEIIVENEEGREEALNRIFLFLEKLGYGKEDIIRTSYLSMLQKKYGNDIK